ncbi:sugar phosphate isomerase/epimerase family protein [Haliscomenobacter hydrossis]|uniref:Xylose isomerase domain-containing protein TIM barrel n=1 Tax=Haliscomenobacter hydrossis (strain ATCC 27775 / DSM 1100 / LMG 10767 / O) TaxID=760192 RepID=F4KV40_HALH1|nr:TIM barrel protein [Haliscomenobacter hydrossis]AEE49206.1 Xylose isomerase domain-containing protein TIM barrel [Haliscomenobacter hydrossis DSM 1100]
MKLGLSTYSFPWAFGVPILGYSPRMSLSDLLHFAHEHKVERVQVGDNCPLHHMTLANLEHLTQLVGHLGIQIEVGTRRLSIENLENYLAFAHIFRSSFLRVVIDDLNYCPDPDQIRAIILKMLPAFKAAGVVLAIENHDRFPARVLRNIIEQTDPEWVGICLDTANSLGANEGIQTVLETLAPYTVNLHLKDIRIQRWPHLMGFRVEGCPAGQGVLNCPEIIAELKKYPRCESLTLELWSSPQHTEAETLQNEHNGVLESLDYLKTIL